MQKADRKLEMTSGAREMTPLVSDVELAPGEEIAGPNDERLWRGAVSATRIPTLPAPAGAPTLTSRSLYSWPSPPSVGMSHDADQRKLHALSIARPALLSNVIPRTCLRLTACVLVEYNGAR